MDLMDIKDPQFLKDLSISELNDLAGQIRSFLIESIAQTGGHFSSNLGVVELTIALHYVFDSPRDKIVFDVGHQSYTHKILTGRAKALHTLRQYEGLSGFQRRGESEHDIWEAGHSSTALSACAGLAVARDLDHQNHEIICVIGDASMMNGETLEALNYLGSISSKVIIILNDNDMSITKNVGGLSNFLSEVRISPEYNHARRNYKQFFKNKKGHQVYQATKKMKDAIKDSLMGDSLFNQFGLDYLGPIDGHDIEDLIHALTAVKNRDQSVVLHVKTVKGKGYLRAEQDQKGYYHGVAPFDIHKGINIKKSLQKHTWSQCIANHLYYLMRQHTDICVITPAMITGSCLNDLFTSFPRRCFDVGIEEEHAMTFVGGLSIGGKFPILTIYSSFAQRAYDQLNHDLARMKLPCLICIDRAGLVGEDGSTHHGVFDISFMLPIPHLVIMTPSNQREAEAMINTAYLNHDGPYVMRYSKNTIRKTHAHCDETLKIGSWEQVITGSKSISVITYGDHVEEIKKMIEEDNLDISLINARFIKPMDEELLKNIADQHLIIYETNMMMGSLASSIALFYAREGLSVTMTPFGIADHYIHHGDVATLLAHEGLDLDHLRQFIKDVIYEKREN